MTAKKYIIEVFGDSIAINWSLWKPDLTANKHKEGFLVSYLLLSAVIAIWSDLFLFSKNVYLPNWTKLLPSPIDTPRYMAFLCLLPVVITAQTFLEATKSAGKVVLMAPLLGIAVWAIKTSREIQAPGEIPFLFINMPYHYVWVVLWQLLLPLALLLCLFSLWRFFAGRLQR